MTKKPTRSFTHADVAAFASKILAPYGKSTYDVKDICYFSETTQPIWLVRYDSLYDGRHIGQHSLVVIEHHVDPAHPWLNVAMYHHVPPGKATVAEEDTAIAEYEQYRREEMRRQYEAMHQSDDDQAKDDDIAQ